MNRSIEESVRRIAGGEPPAELRDRVLSAAVFADQPITWSDRVWFSRAWRTAAVAVALVAVVLDQVAASPRQTIIVASEQALAEARAIDEAGREAGLPPEMAAALARRALSDTSRTRVPPQSASEQQQEFTRESGGDRQ
jgi:hypothetical protein